MAASLSVALVIVFVIRTGAPPTERLGMALRATARWSFVLFWLASTGGALSTLFGSSFHALKVRARDFALAFASAHLAHVGLIGWLYYTATGSPLPPSRAVFFGIGIFWTYLLAILSIKRVSEKLDPDAWRRLRTLGVEYINLIFIFDFANKPFHGGVNLLVYLPFLALAVAGPVLRLAAAVKRFSQPRISLTVHQ
jgi:hypothetical protein